MQHSELLIAVVMEEQCLSLAQVSAICQVEPAWLLRHVDEGLLSASCQENGEWCFSYAEVTRARRILSLERDFDALPELAALVADMQEELDGLRRQLQCAAVR